MSVIPIKPVESTGYEQMRATLRGYFQVISREASVPFRFGVNDFPPFVAKSALYGGSGVLPAFIQGLAADLEQKSKPMQCDWSDFIDKLKSEAILALAAPMMPIHAGAYDVVSMFKLGCCAAFYSKSVSEHKINRRKRAFTAVAESFVSLRARSAERRLFLHGADLKRGAAKRLKSSLGTLTEAFDGVASGKDFFESHVLDKLITKSREELTGQLPAESAIEQASKGRLVVVDLTTLRQIERLLESTFNEKFEFRPLFGEYIYVDAGPIFVYEAEGPDGRKTDLPLAEFCAEFWRSDSGECKSRAVKELEDWLSITSVTPYPFLINNDSDVQVIGSDESNIIQYLLGEKSENTNESAEIYALHRPLPLKLGTSQHKYLLRDPKFLAVDANGAHLGPLRGAGNTEAEALDDLGLVLHDEFQRLRRLLPHERSIHDEEIWTSLTNIIDVPAYEASVSPAKEIIGEVTSRRKGIIGLEIFNDFPNGAIEVRLDDLPGPAAATKVGETFGVRRRVRADGSIEWSEWRVRKRLRDDDSVWRDFLKRRDSEGE